MKDKMKVNFKSILNKYEQQGKIDNWGYDTYNDWRNVPFLEIKGITVFLCETFVKFSGLNLLTIKDYSYSGAINMINYIIENIDVLPKEMKYVSYKDIKEYKHNEDFWKDVEENYDKF